MDIPTVECFPKESPIYGGYNISISISSTNYDEILSKLDHFYLVFEGSELRHSTKVSSVTSQDVNNVITFSGTTPGHNKAENTRITLCKLSSNQEVIHLCTTRHFFTYDSHYQLAQYILNCHLSDQLHRLGDDDLEEICDVKLLQLNPNECIDVDKKLTRAFKHIVAKHGSNNISLLYQTGMQGVRAQDTLVHFACKFGMLRFAKFLLKLRGGEECLTTPDTDGQLPIDVAQNAGHSNLVNVLSRNAMLLLDDSDSDVPVVTTNFMWVNRDLGCDISELNLLINVQRSSRNDSPVTYPGMNQREGAIDANQTASVMSDDNSNNFVSSSSTMYDTSSPVSDRSQDVVDLPAPIVFTSASHEVTSDLNLTSASLFHEQNQPPPTNLTDEDKSSKMNASTLCMENSSSRILENNLVKLRQIHDGIQQIRSSYTMQQRKRCENQDDIPSQSWQLLNNSGSNMSSDGDSVSQSDAHLVCDHVDENECNFENKSVKIRVNDVTPSGSQEHLCLKTEFCDHETKLNQTKDNTDGFGNVRMQLEHRNKKSQKEVRRQSWTGDDHNNHNSVQASQKSNQTHSSLSSMDSDADETFFDAQDHAALYGKNDFSALKQKRPSSLGDVDTTEDNVDLIKSEYSSRCSANSLSLQCLFDVLPTTNKEPKTTDDLCSKSLSEHQITQLLNAPLAPPRSLLKSVSTPSIIAVNDACKKWSENSVVMDDTQTATVARKQTVTVSPNQDSDEDKPFKSKKRSSFFFKKKWGKEKEVKKSNHQFVSVCYSTATFCDVCAKTLCNKTALCCDTCLVKVHEGCREQISDCSKLKNSRALSKTASYHLPSSSIKEKLTTSSSFKNPSSGPMFPNTSPSHLSRNTRSSENSFSATTIQDAFQLNAQKSSGSSPGKVICEDKESDILEDSHMNIVDTNSASVESLDDGSGDDSDLDDDAELQLRLDEPEQWSSLVDRKFTKKMKEKDVKRQESIYELILTEKHHVLTLKIMQKIFAHGMKKEVQLSSDVVDRIFPSLDYLLEIHSSFLRQLRERQKEYTIIPTIGDLLVQQFMGEKAQQLSNAYGEFCSQHQEAISLYKDILKSDRKFQLFIKKCSIHPLCKTRSVPSCMLLVTQRITKYPLVIDGIIKTTRENEEDKCNLIEALSLVKGIITKVNSKVTEKEKELRLIEIYNKVDAKSTAFYHGKKFKKSDLLSGKRKLHCEGMLIWKSARGKPLEVMTVVLSDIIIFLQENNQKYTFVSQDNKSGILSLQKLLVREKAGQDNRGIYLISSNQKEPEMYELGCSSSKDKKVWIENIRYAIENYPDEEEVSTNDYSTDKKLIDVKVARVKHLLASLHEKDMCIAQMCEDKMQILLELLEADFKPEVSLDVKYTSLLDTKHDPGETRNLLMASLNEASRIASSLYISGSNLSRSVSSVGEHQSETFTSPTLPKRAETFGGFDSPIKEQNPLNLKKKLMILKENEKVRGTSVSCTVSPVHEEDGDHLCPAGIHDVRRLSGPPAITESVQDQSLKRNANSTNTLTSIAWGGVIKAKSNEKSDWTDASSPSISEDAVSQNDTVNELLSLNAVAPSLLAGGKDQLSATIQLTHQLNRLQCLFSQHFTSYETLKTEYTQLSTRQSGHDSEPRDIKEKRSLYKHNQRLEELRNLQEQLREERQILEKERNVQNDLLESRDLELDKLQEQLRVEQQDVKDQREKLYKQLEVLKRQGILLSPSMQIVNTSLQSPPMESETPKSPPQSETVSSWELRASKHDSTPRKHSATPTTDHKIPSKPDATSKQRNAIGPGGITGVFSKRPETNDRQTLPVHLCSATNQQKTIHSPVVTQSSSIRQQLPMKLANLSMGLTQGTSLENSPILPNSAPPNSTSQNESPQFLPMKLAMEGNRHTKSNPIRTSSFGGSPKTVIPQGGYVHQRAGSSPAKMHGLSQTQHSDETNCKPHNSTMPKEKTDKKDVGKKFNNSPDQEIIFF